MCRFDVVGGDKEYELTLALGSALHLLLDDILRLGVRDGDDLAFSRIRHSHALLPGRIQEAADESTANTPLLLSRANELTPSTINLAAKTRFPMKTSPSKFFLFVKFRKKLFQIYQTNS